MQSLDIRNNSNNVIYNHKLKLICEFWLIRPNSLLSMKNIHKISLIILTVAVLCFSFGMTGLAQTIPQVQTNSATNVSNYQATLNGYLSASTYYSNYVYFQWGTTTSYGYQTTQQYLSATGSFSQNIANLTPNTTYHFRAVVQGSYGTVYGQDMTLYATGNGSTGSGTLSISKKVINLTSGSLNWQTSVSANPSDYLSFVITLQANSQDIHNVVVRDVLPPNMIYKGNMTVNANTNYGGDISSGINIGTVYVNQPVVVAYQAQVAPAANFGYGSTVLANNANVTSQEVGTQNSSATVTVNRSLVYSASTYTTGLTNDFLTDSFFMPLLLIMAGLWLYFSGKAYKFADWMKQRI